MEYLTTNEGGYENKKTTNNIMDQIPRIYINNLSVFFILDIIRKEVFQ
jgi:hypothetical protein